LASGDDVGGAKDVELVVGDAGDERTRLQDALASRAGGSMDIGR
jgi:hypothetical protein